MKKVNSINNPMLPEIILSKNSNYLQQIILNPNNMATGIFIPLSGKIKDLYDSKSPTFRREQ